MIGPGTLTFITTALEKLVNTALKYDPATRQQLSQLTGVLAIHIQQPDVSIYCQGGDDGLRLMAQCEIPPSAEITGTPQALMALLKKPTNLADTDLSVSGNIGFLQQWQNALGQIDIDWEDAISSVLGDIAGPLVADTLRKGATWAKQTHQENWRLLKEYLPEELQLVPSKVELEDFYLEVSQLSMDTDRLAAKLQRLQTTLSKHIANSKDD